MAPSRLVFAIARDGVLPFASWVQHITPDKRPRNAILLVYIYSALLLCSSLPSAVAFSSLISIGCVPLAATYGLIGLLRLTVSSGKFRRTKFPLGYFAKPFYFCSALYGGVMVAVSYWINLQLFIDVNRPIRCSFRHFNSQWQGRISTMWVVVNEYDYYIDESWLWRLAPYSV